MTSLEWKGSNKRMGHVINLQTNATLFTILQFIENHIRQFLYSGLIIRLLDGSSCCRVDYWMRGRDNLSFLVEIFVRGLILYKALQLIWCYLVHNKRLTLKIKAVRSNLDQSYIFYSAWKYLISCQTALISQYLAACTNRYPENYVTNTPDKTNNWQLPDIFSDQILVLSA